MTSNHLINIKVMVEMGQGSGAAGGGTTPGGGAGGTAAPDVSFASLKELQKAFADLAAEVRAVQKAFTDVKSAADPKGTGAKGASEAGSAAPGGFSELAKVVAGAATGVRNQAEATSEHAASVKKETAATEEATDASERKAKADRTSAETAEKVASSEEKKAKATAGTAKANDEAAATELRRVKALKSLLGGADIKKGGKLHPVGLFENVFKPIGESAGLKSAAGKVEGGVDDLFDVGKTASTAAKTAQAGLRKAVGLLFSDLASKVQAGTATAKHFGETRGAAERLVATENKQLAQGQKVGFDSQEAARRLGALNLLTQVQRVEADIGKLGDALETGADSIEISKLQSAFNGVMEMMTKFAVSGAGQAVFSTNRRTGREPFEGATEQQRLIKANLDVRPPPIKLAKEGRSALREMNEAILDTKRPATIVSRIMKEMVNKGRGLGKIEDNLRAFMDVISEFKEVDFPDRESFKRFNDAQKLLSGVKVGKQGQVEGPAGTISRADSLLAAQRAVQNLKAKVGRRPAGAGEDLELNIPTQAGGLKKLIVTLKQVGKGIDNVKIKARDASKQMFDRTSMRAALSRVATWGAAAGIIYGAVNAFRSAIRAMVDTESALIGLAKVMDESNRGLDAFKKKARDAAVSIAQDFGQPLADVLETMILFGQQGKSLADAIDLAKASALAANVTTLDQTTAANALTAATAQFGIEAAQATSIVDKFNEVSNNAAVTETVLAEALKKAGLAAKNSGVSLDELNGIIAAISEQTRQSGQQIGTALRFIFSRLTTSEAETGLGRVGVAARDVEGNFRGFMPIIDELAVAWDGLSQSQRTSVSIAISGTRRFNTLMALMDNFAEFQDSTANSVNSSGSAMKEQQKVMQTAGFRIQQLKNSLTGLAVSFGDSLLDPMKAIVTTFKGLIDVLSAIPGPIKTMAAGIGLGTLAFVKFSDHIVDFLGLSGAMKSSTAILGGTLRRNLTLGIPRSEQALRGGEKFTELAFGTVAAREVADFATPTKGAAGFSAALKEQNLTLLDNKGKIVAANRQYGKFGATMRGFRTVDTTALNKFGAAAGTSGLAIAGMNSGLTRFALFLGIIANKIFKLTVIGPLAFAGIARAAKGASAATWAFGTALGSISRFLVAGAAIWYGIKGLRLLGDAARESGKEVEEELGSELQKRKEAVAAVNKHTEAFSRLGKERRKSAAAGIGTSPFDALRPEQAEAVRRGRFKSPFLEQQRFLREQQEVTNAVGFSNPQLIESVDKFGNVVLESADAFDALAASAGRAHESLLAITQLKALEGFAKQLQPRSDTYTKIFDFLRSGDPFGVVPKDWGRNEANEFADQLKSYRKALDKPIVSASRELGVSLELLDKDAAAQLFKAGAKFAEASANIRIIVKDIKDRIKALPPEAGQDVFRSLATGATGDFFQREAENRSLEGGRRVTKQQSLNQSFLQNRGAFQGAFGNLIGVSAEESIGRFREAGIVEEVLDTRKDIEEQLRSLSGGELILFENVKGMPRQAVVEVTATGKRQLRFIADDLGTFGVEALNKAFAESSGKIVYFDPTRLKEQAELAMLEIGRIVAGAGRGGILGKDIDLGAKFRFDLSAQQRAAQADELLFADLTKAQQTREASLKDLGATAKEFREDADKPIGQEKIAEIHKLSRAFDELATVARFRTEIEEVAKTFEKAVEDIQRSRLTETIKAEFSGILGAGQGLTERRFEAPKLRRELTSEQRFDEGAQDFVQLANALAEGEKAAGEFVAGLAVAERNIGTFLRDFEQAYAAGGSRDPAKLSALTRRAAAVRLGGLSRFEALQVTLAGEQLSETERTNRLILRLVEQSEGRELGAAIAEASRLTARNPEQQGRVAERIRQLGPGGLGEGTFSTADLETVLRHFSALEVPDVANELLQRRAKQATSSVNTEILKFLFDRQEKESGKFAAAVAQKLEESIAGGSQVLAATQQQAFAKLFNPEEVRKAFAGSFEGEELTIDAAALDEFLRTQIGKLTEFPNETVQARGRALQDTLEEGGPAAQQLRAVVEKFAREMGALERDSRENIKKIPEVNSAKQKESRAREMKAMALTTRAFKALVKPTKDAVAAFFSFGNTITKATQDLTAAVSKFVDDINIGRDLREFTTPQFGLLEGVGVPQADLGKAVGARVTDLSTRELTSLESPGLAHGVTEADEAFEGLLDQLRKIKELEATARRDRVQFESAGNVKGIKLADTALKHLGGMASLVEGQLRNAQGTLREFGNAFRNIEAVNQLRIDIEKLFETFQKEISLDYDRTSIETALGKTVFSFIRPTFEQFEQGQRGFITKFERALAGVSFKERTGAITPQEATKERRKATFGRDEELIAFAQQKENSKLQAAIRTAEQVRSRLFDFVQGGGPGAEVAQDIIEQLTEELEAAGDITPSGLGRQQVRDPRTGRMVDIPASQVMQFQGVPSLRGATKRVGEIAQQVRRAQAKEAADMITEPMVAILSDTNTKLDEIRDALRKASGITKGDIEFANASGVLSSELSSVIAALVEGGTPEELDRLTSSLSVLSTLTPETLARAFRTVSISTDEGGTESLYAALLRLGNDIDDVAVKGRINSLFDRANEAAEDTFAGVKIPASQLEELVAKPGGEVAKAFEDIASASEPLAKRFEEIAVWAKKLATTPFGGGQRLAAGGVVVGPGGPRSDQVPIMASAGEFVLNARAARNIGVPQLNALNKGTGAVRSDPSIEGTPSIRLAGGGDIAKEIAKLKRRQQELIGKGERGGELTAGEITEKLQIDRDVQRLEARRGGLVQLRIRRQEKLAEMKALGVTQTEEGFTIFPEGAQLDTPGLAEAVAAEQIRRESLAGRAGQRSRFSQFELRTVSEDQSEELQKEIRSKKVFVRKTRDGRLSFSGSSDRGGLDLASFAGVDAQDPDAVFKEAKRREDFSRSVKASRALRRKEIETEFFDLSTEESDAVASEDRQRKLDVAIGLLNTELKKRSSTFLSDLPQKTDFAYNLLRSAADFRRRLGLPDVGITSSILDVDLTRKQEERPAKEDLRALANDLNRAADDLEPKLLRLNNTKARPHILSLPLGLEYTPQGGFLRRGEASSVNLAYDPFTGDFKPEIFGFAINTNEGVEKFLNSLVPSPFSGVHPSLDEVLREAAAVSNSDSRFSGFVGRETQASVRGIARNTLGAKDAITSLIGDNVVSDVLGGGVTAIGTGATLVTQIGGGLVGIGGDIAADLTAPILDEDGAIIKSEDRFRNSLDPAGDLLRLNPLVMIPEILGSTLPNYAASQEEIRDLKVLMSVEKDPVKRQEFRAAIEEAKLKRNADVSGAALALVGGASLLKRVAKRVRKVPGERQARRQAKRAAPEDLQEFRDASARSVVGKTPGSVRTAHINATKAFQEQINLNKAKKIKATRKVAKAEARAGKKASKEQRRQRIKQERAEAQALRAQEKQAPAESIVARRRAKAREDAVKSKAAVERSEAQAATLESAADTAPKAELGLKKRALRGAGGLAAATKVFGPDLLTGGAATILAAFPELLTSIPKVFKGAKGLKGKFEGKGIRGFIPSGAQLKSLIDSPFEAIGRRVKGRFAQGVGKFGGVSRTTRLVGGTIAGGPLVGGLAAFSPDVIAALIKKVGSLPGFESLKNIFGGRRGTKGPPTVELGAVTAPGALPSVRAPLNTLRRLDRIIERRGGPKNASKLLTERGPDGTPFLREKHLTDLATNPSELTLGSLTTESKRLGLPPGEFIKLKSERLGRARSQRVAQAADKLRVQQEAVAVGGVIPSGGGRRVLVSDAPKGGARRVSDRQRLLDFAAGKLSAEEFFGPGARSRSPAAINKIIEDAFGPPKQLRTTGEITGAEGPKARRRLQGEGSVPEEVLPDLFNDAIRRPRRFASGGKIQGPGGPRSDRIPILASSGEFVLSAASVSKIGTPILDFLNKTGKLPGFKHGGVVGDNELPFKGGVFAQPNRAPGLVIPQGEVFSIGKPAASIFDQLAGKTQSIDVSAALKHMHRGGAAQVFVNEITGEELLANPVYTNELAQAGFVEKVDPDLELLAAIGRGAALFTHRRTGETIAASGALAADLAKRGFFPNDKSLSDVLSRDVLIDKQGGITLVSKTGDSVHGFTQTPFEKALEGVPPLFRDDPELRRGLQQKVESDIDKARSPLAYALDKDLEAFRAGGMLHGPGGPTGDKIPILASDGEFVVSANAVNRIGVPMLKYLNEGGSLSNLPKFAQGGEVGGDGSGGLQLSVNTEEIAAAIKDAILTSIRSESINIDGDAAAAIITTAIESAFNNIDLPEIKVDTADIRVVAPESIPLDVSALNGLNLGGALGADVRNRLDEVDGRATAALERTNEAEELLGRVDFDKIDRLLLEGPAAGGVSMEEVSAALETQKAELEYKIGNTVEFKLNERLNADTTEVDVGARIDKELVIVNTDITRLRSDVNDAMMLAKNALGQATRRV